MSSLPIVTHSKFNSSTFLDGDWYLALASVSAFFLFAFPALPAIIAAEGGPNEFDPDILKDPSRSLLITYISINTSLFHCREIGV